jgi:hypothetical protein
MLNPFKRIGAKKREARIAEILNKACERQPEREKEHQALNGAPYDLGTRRQAVSDRAVRLFYRARLKVPENLAALIAEMVR